MLIKIDSRERNISLFDAFDIACSNKDIKWEKTFLEVGDVSCGNIVIERKEASDFIGSIMDGRLREQAAKMSLNYPYKYVIIEGNPFRTKSNINHHAIIGKMTSLLVKHNIRLLNVETPQQFAYACISIIEKHISENEFNSADFVKLQYKIADSDIITAMIYQIPGLGYEKAKQIAEMYHFNLDEFVHNANIESLTGIKGIGKKTAEKIIQLCHPM